jgi:hypothetical protein
LLTLLLKASNNVVWTIKPEKLIPILVNISRCEKNEFDEDKSLEYWETGLMQTWE